MEGHVKAVGILHILFGVLGVLGLLALGVLLLIFGAGILTVITGAADSGKDAAAAAGVFAVLGVLMIVVLGIAVLWSSISIFVGFGLLKRKNSARIIAVVLAFLSLGTSVPSVFTGGGTIPGLLGIGYCAYTLWVLLSEEGARLFKQYSY